MENYSRRHILKTSLWTFGALCLGLPGILVDAREPKNAAGGLLNWDEFVEKLERAARVQHNPAWNRTSYVGSVACFLAKLNPLDATLRQAITLLGSPVFTRPHFAELRKTTDVQISLITFDKGEWLPHHDHPSMTGVLTCASGELQVGSYDRVQAPEVAGSSTILLKKLGSDLITPGKISTLTDTRRNIHYVKAQSFTQVIDIFTPPYNTERTNKTNWYRVEPRPVNGLADLFAAYPLHGSY